MLPSLPASWVFLSICGEGQPTKRFYSKRSLLRPHMNRLWCMNDLLLFLQHLHSALYPFQGSCADHGTLYFGRRKMYAISQFSKLPTFRSCEASCSQIIDSNYCSCDDYFCIFLLHPHIVFHRNSNGAASNKAEAVPRLWESVLIHLKENDTSEASEYSSSIIKRPP